MHARQNNTIGATDGARIQAMLAAEVSKAAVQLRRRCQQKNSLVCPSQLRKTSPGHTRVASDWTTAPRDRSLAAAFADDDAGADAEADADVDAGAGGGGGEQDEDEEDDDFVHE